jgi:hypothetical protein
MNSQELRNLQEAYLEVYQELDEDRVPVRKRGGVSAPEGERSIPGQPNRRNKDYWASVEGEDRDRGAGSKAKRRAALNKEDVDIYHIILSHLLDEGYAETPEAAEKIMVNMSEEWREEIMEGVRPENVEEPLNKVTFKKRRRSLAGREERADARSRGHVDRLTGKPYGTEEAASRRKNLNPAERESRRRFAEDPA